MEIIKKFSEYKKLKIDSEESTYSFTLKVEDLPSNYFYIVYQINFGKTETYTLIIKC